MILAVVLIIIIAALFLAMLYFIEVSFKLDNTGAKMSADPRESPLDRQ